MVNLELVKIKQIIENHSIYIKNENVSFKLLNNFYFLNYTLILTYK